MTAPPQLRELARAHQAQRQTLVTAATVAAGREWARVDRADISASWAAALPRVTLLVSGAQLAAAQQAQPYVTSAVAAQGLPPVAEWALAAGALSGVAADGRDLASLLAQPAIAALMGLRDGQPVERAVASGVAVLDRIVRTEVADAGRIADGIATTVTPAASGYVRLVVGETCARCIVLAGRVYPWSRGFLRHPSCDCVMIPVDAAQAAGIAQDPRSVYASMSDEQRAEAGWSRAERAAIDAGADIARVTNVHRRGVYTAGGRRYTLEAAGKRPRITPEQIYRDARGDRDEAIRLLRLHRYVR